MRLTVGIVFRLLRLPYYWPVGGLPEEQGAKWMF
jgi:hypothetical protein